jgi:hypothetical protein
MFRGIRKQLSLPPIQENQIQMDKIMVYQYKVGIDSSLRSKT